MILVMAAPTKLQLSEGFVRFAQCQKITGLPPEVIALIDGRDVTEAKFCTYRPNVFFPAQYKGEIELTEPQEKGSRVRKITEFTFPATSKGIITQAIEIDHVFRDLVLLLGSALLLARGRRSPGKALLKIKLVGQGCAICREFRRIGPFLIYSITILAIEVLNVTLVTTYTIPSSVVLVTLAGLSIAYIYYYVWPLIWWRGQTRYDQATGFHVVSQAQSVEKLIP